MTDKTLTPPNIEREELRNILIKLCWVVNPAGTEDVDKAMAAIDTYVEQAVKEAEQRGVAWSVGVLDNLHEQNPDPTADHVYKGAKNTLRDRFEAETGVDPAPSYPIHVKLTATPHQKEEGGE